MQVSNDVALSMSSSKAPRRAWLSWPQNLWFRVSVIYSADHCKTFKSPKRQSRNCWIRVQSLRTRTLFILSGLIVLVAAFVWAVLYLVYPPCFGQLENLYVTRGASTLSYQLHRQFLALSKVALDDSNWDDVAQLAIDGAVREGQDFLDNSFSDDVLISLGTDFMLYYTISGSFLFGRVLPSSPFPEELRAVPASSTLRSALHVPGTISSGFLLITRTADTDANAALSSHSLALVSASAIRLSNNTGFFGLLIVGRYMNDDVVFPLAQSSQSCLALFSFPRPGHWPSYPADVSDAILSVTTRNYQAFQPPTDPSEAVISRIMLQQHTRASKLTEGNVTRLCAEVDSDSIKPPISGDLLYGEDRISGFLAYLDVFGSPCVLLRADWPRDIMRDGTNATYFAYALLAAFGFIFGAVVLAATEFFSVRPVAKLIASMKDIAENVELHNNTTKRAVCIGFGEGDDLRFLSQAINRVLDTLQTSREQLEAEKRKSDDLLFSMMPEKIAARLKLGESLIADSYESATCMFIDICDFTPLCLLLSPAEVVEILNIIFSVIDDIVRKRGLEKVKNIGDAAMIVAGVPEPSHRHVQDTIDTALDVLDELEVVRARHGINVKVRIGVATGPIVAGVIGTFKCMYDVWGNTVNEASRMQSHGVQDCIHMTEASAMRLPPSYPTQYRGTIQIKGRGPMKTWLLKRRKKRAMPAPKLTEAVPTGPDAYLLALQQPGLPPQGSQDDHMQDNWRGCTSSVGTEDQLPEHCQHLRPSIDPASGLVAAVSNTRRPSILSLTASISSEGARLREYPEYPVGLSEGCPRILSPDSQHDRGGRPYEHFKDGLSVVSVPATVGRPGTPSPEYVDAGALPQSYPSLGNGHHGSSRYHPSGLDAAGQPVHHKSHGPEFGVEEALHGHLGRPDTPCDDGLSLGFPTVTPGPSRDPDSAADSDPDRQLYGRDRAAAEAALRALSTLRARGVLQALSSANGRPDPFCSPPSSHVSPRHAGPRPTSTHVSVHPALRSAAEGVPPALSESESEQPECHCSDALCASVDRATSHSHRTLSPSLALAASQHMLSSMDRRLVLSGSLSDWLSDQPSDPDSDSGLDRGRESDPERDWLKASQRNRSRGERHGPRASALPLGAHQPPNHLTLPGGNEGYHTPQVSVRRHRVQAGPPLQVPPLTHSHERIAFLSAL